MSSDTYNAAARAMTSAVPNLWGRCVLVTGANGFLGAEVCRLLSDAGAVLLPIVRPGADTWRLSWKCPQATLHTLDLEDQRAVHTMVADLQPAVIVHLAGALTLSLGAEAYQQVWRANVLTTVALAEAAAAAKVSHIILAGSCAEYAPSSQALRETSPLDPRTPYAASKTAAWALTCGVCAGSATITTALRLFTLYGPGERTTRFVPAVILSCLRREPFAMTVGTQRRDYLYVADAARAVLHAAALLPASNTIINVGSGRAIAISDLADRICRLTGRSTDLLHKGALPLRPAEFPYQRADITRTRTLLHWTPQITPTQGLLRTIGWYRDNLSFLHSSTFHPLGMTNTRNSSQFKDVEHYSKPEADRQRESDTE